jgi:hypothetical protein
VFRSEAAVRDTWHADTSCDPIALELFPGHSPSHDVAAIVDDHLPMEQLVHVAELIVEYLPLEHAEHWPPCNDL